MLPSSTTLVCKGWYTLSDKIVHNASMCRWNCEQVLAPSVYSLYTIHHKLKFVGFVCEHKGNYDCFVDRFFHVCELHTYCLHFFAFFSMWTVQCSLSVGWNDGSLCVHLMFVENWFTAHLLWTLHKPHSMIKVCMCVLGLTLFWCNRRIPAFVERSWCNSITHWCYTAAIMVYLFTLVRDSIIAQAN